MDEKKLFFTFNKILNTKECNRIEEEILNALENANVVVFDLGKVEYIASSFLKLCVTVQKATNHFSVINTTPEVYKVFKISGLTEFLNIS